MVAKKHSSGQYYVLHFQVLLKICNTETNNSENVSICCQVSNMGNRIEYMYIIHFM